MRKSEEELELIIPGYLAGNPEDVQELNSYLKYLNEQDVKDFLDFYISKYTETEPVFSLVKLNDNLDFIAKYIYLDQLSKFKNIDLKKIAVGFLNRYHYIEEGIRYFFDLALDYISETDQLRYSDNITNPEILRKIYNNIKNKDIFREPAFGNILLRNKHVPRDILIENIENHRAFENLKTRDLTKEDIFKIKNKLSIDKKEYYARSIIDYIESYSINVNISNWEEDKKNISKFNPAILKILNNDVKVLENKMLISYFNSGGNITKFYHEFLKNNPNGIKEIDSIEYDLNHNYASEYEFCRDALNLVYIINKKFTNFQHYFKLYQRLRDFCKLLHEHGNARDFSTTPQHNFLIKLFESKVDLESKTVDNLFFINKIRKLTITKRLKEAAQKGWIKENYLALREEYLSSLENKVLSGETLSREDLQKIYDLGSQSWALENGEEIEKLNQLAQPKNKTLFILNANIGGYSFEVLPDKDFRMLTIGNDTDCCQTLSGVGSGAVEDSYINPLAGVLALYKNNNILAQSYFHHVPQDNGFILDNIEWNEKNCKKYGLDQNSLAKLYADWESSIKTKYPELNYIKVGLGYLKINEDLFFLQKEPEDPRSFSVEEPYSDFDNAKHIDLLKPKPELMAKQSNIKSNYIKLASVLVSTPQEEIVKVSGILAQLKNWFKSKINAEFARELDVFRKDNDDIAKILIQLNNYTKAAAQAIKDGEIDKYQQSLQQVKDFALQLWAKIKRSEKSYTIMEMSNPDFKEKIQQKLPENIKLGPQSIKLIELYPNLNQDEINISDNLKLKFEQIYSGSVEDIKKAILLGTVTRIDPKTPSDQVKHMPFGALELKLVASLGDIKIKLTLVDFINTETQDHKISVRKIDWYGKTKEASLVKEALVPQVPIKITSLSDDQFAEALKKGYRLTFGKDPSLAVLAFGWAQGTLEAGRPIKLPNNNIGNIKATDSWLKAGNPYFVRDTKEYDKTGKSYKEIGTRWKSFNSPEEGAAEYWKLLASRYPDALKWAEVGDAKSAAISLGTKHYYTAPIRSYSSGVDKLFKEFMRKNLGTEPVKPIEESSEVDSLIKSLLAYKPITNLVKIALENQ